MEVVHRVKILNKLGFHLRAAAQFVKTVSKFKCRVLVKSQDGHVDGKSLMNLLTLAASYGSELVIIYQGEDAKAAQAMVHDLFMSKFGEKE